MHPQFGFVFHIEGHEQHHFVWELLDSHATDLWSRAKNEMSLSDMFKEMDGIINFIRNHGRTTYKSQYKNQIENEDWSFNVIDHDDASSKLKDGFVKWKYRIEELLN